MMPPTLGSEPHHREARVLAERVDAPGVVTQRGSARVEAEVAARESGADEGDALAMTSRLTIVLGPATIERTSVYEIEQGMIAREREARVVSTRLFTVERRERVLTPRR
jgi:hypothetical protein